MEQLQPSSIQCANAIKSIEMVKNVLQRLCYSIMCQIWHMVQLSPISSIERSFFFSFLQMLQLLQIFFVLKPSTARFLRLPSKNKLYKFLNVHPLSIVLNFSIF